MKTPVTLLISIFLFILSCDGNVRSENTSSSNLIAMVMQNGKYGYVNTNGEFIIEPKYKLARSFSNGFASVNLNGKRNDLVSGVVGGNYVFIDVNGKVVLDNKTFNEPMYYYNDFATMYLSKNRGGFINTKGELVKEHFSIIHDFKDGLANAVKFKENKIGFIDSKGDWKIAFDFDQYDIGEFSEGLARIQQRATSFNEQPKWGFIDKEGDFTIDPKFMYCTDFREGLAIVRDIPKYDAKEKRMSSNFRFIDKSGQVVIDASDYDQIYSFSEGLSPVKKRNKWGFINRKGEVQIEFLYDYVGAFHDGLANYRTNENKIGFISKSGEKAFETEFKNASKFKNGYAIFLGENDKLGFINQKGEVVIEPQFERAGYFIDPNESNIDKTVEF